MLELENRRLKL